MGSCRDIPDVARGAAHAGGRCPRTATGLDRGRGDGVEAADRESGEAKARCCIEGCDATGDAEEAGRVDSPEGNSRDANDNIEAADRTGDCFTRCITVAIGGGIDLARCIAIVVRGNIDIGEDRIVDGIDFAGCVETPIARCIAIAVSRRVGIGGAGDCCNTRSSTGTRNGGTNSIRVGARHGTRTRAVSRNGRRDTRTRCGGTRGNTRNGSTRRGNGGYGNNTGTDGSRDRADRRNGNNTRADGSRGRTRNGSIRSRRVRNGPTRGDARTGGNGRNGNNTRTGGSRGRARAVRRNTRTGSRSDHRDDTRTEPGIREANTGASTTTRRREASHTAASTITTRAVAGTAATDLVVVPRRSGGTAAGAAFTTGRGNTAGQARIWIDRAARQRDRDRGEQVRPS